MRFTKERGAAVMLAVLILYALSGIVLRRDYAAVEMRELAPMPKLSHRNILGGKFGEEFEAYYADRVALKPELFRLHSLVRYAMGIREENGVLTGSSLYQRPLDMPRLETIAKGPFAEKLKIIALPYKLYYAEDLPLAHRIGELRRQYVAAYDERIRNLGARDLSGVLSRKDYYESDHHLNAQGVEAVVQALDLGAYAQGPSVFFSGGLTRKTGLLRRDRFTAVFPEGFVDPGFTFGPREREQGRAHILQPERLSGSDAYLYYMGGNYGEVHIQGSGRGKMLLLKDSFANPFIAFFARTCAQLTVVDLRFYKGDLDALMASVDRILYFGAL